MLSLIDLGRPGPQVEETDAGGSTCTTIVPYQAPAPKVIIESSGWARMPRWEDFWDEGEDMGCVAIGIASDPEDEASAIVRMDEDLEEAMRAPPLPAERRGISRQIQAAAALHTPRKNARGAKGGADSGVKVPVPHQLSSFSYTDFLFAQTPPHTL